MALLRAGHPIPTVAVTLAATVLSACAGNTVSTCALVASAVLTGQLTVGWTNDRFDLSADREMSRTEKPLAAGQVAASAVDLAIVVGTVLTIALSLALGWRAALVHLAAVSCGWLYNFWLKGTWLSWLPYSAAFAALPTVATLVRPNHTLPPGWLVLGAGLLGAAANLTNTLPDLARQHPDRFRGLPDRIGAHASLLGAAAISEGCVILAAAGPRGPITPVGWTGLTFVTVILTATVPLLWRAAGTRRPFYALMALSGVDLILVACGTSLR